MVTCSRYTAIPSAKRICIRRSLASRDQQWCSGDRSVKKPILMPTSAPRLGILTFHIEDPEKILPRKPWRLDAHTPQCVRVSSFQMISAIFRTQTLNFFWNRSTLSAIFRTQSLRFSWVHAKPVVGIKTSFVMKWCDGYTSREYNSHRRAQVLKDHVYRLI